MNTLIVARGSNHELLVSVGELQASKLINDRISSESERIALLEQKSNPMDTLMSNNDDESSDAFVLFENRVNQLEVDMRCE
eukprot:scaffold143881_cov62-Attheya_sp.AAC.2